VPVCTLMVDTESSESPAGLIPPSTVRPLLPATTVSRDTGTGNCHDSTPASMEPGPTRCTGREAMFGETDRTGDGDFDPPGHATTTIVVIRATTRTAPVAALRRCRRIRRARWARFSTVSLLTPAQSALRHERRRRFWHGSSPTSPGWAIRITQVKGGRDLGALATHHDSRKVGTTIDIEIRARHVRVGLGTQKRNERPDLARISGPTEESRMPEILPDHPHGVDQALRVSAALRGETT